MDPAIEELNRIVDQAESLLRSLGEEGGEAAEAVRERVNETLDQAKARLAATSAEAEEVVESLADRADDYVRSNPWQAVAIAALLGGVVTLLHRRSRCAVNDGRPERRRNRRKPLPRTTNRGASGARAVRMHLLRMLETRVDAAGIALQAEMPAFSSRLQLQPARRRGRCSSRIWGGIVLLAIVLPPHLRVPVLAAVVAAFVIGGVVGTARCESRDVARARSAR